MPGWEFVDVDTAAPLRPTLVAWGEDAVWGADTRAQNAVKYEAMGVRLLAANVWMLTATKEKLVDSPDLVNASCVDIEGERIVPPWLEGDLNGVPDYWGCTNQPAFREQLVQRTRDGIAAGANLLHLDDHLGTAAAAEHSGGCFCDACMAGFRSWLKAEFDAGELAAREISAIDEFDYKAYLAARGIDDRRSYDARVSSLPLRQEFLGFQRAAAAAFIEELRTQAERSRGGPVPLGINAWNLEASQLANAHLADYFSNELSHYGKEGSDPPFFYKLADALGRPMMASATGDDWAKINAGDESERVRSWLAMAYAFGHHFMYSFRQWAFDPASGTSWYEPDVEIYRPIAEFVTNNARLLDDYEPVANVGVLVSNDARADGDTRAMRLALALHDQSIQFRLIVAGDGILDHELRSTDADGLSRVCLFPSQQLSAEQQRVVDQWLLDGLAAECEDPSEISTPRVRFAGGVSVWGLVKQKSSGEVVVHVLNRNLIEHTGAPVPVEHLEVTLPYSLVGEVTAIRAHAPEHEPTPLPLRTLDDSVVVSLPRLERWSLLEIE